MHHRQGLLCPRRSCCHRTWRAASLGTPTTWASTPAPPAGPAALAGRLRAALKRPTPAPPLRGARAPRTTSSTCGAVHPAPGHPPVQSCGPKKPHEGGLLAVTALRRPLPAPWTPFDTVRCGLCSSLISGFARLRAEDPCHDSMATCPDRPWLAPHVHDHLGQATCTFTAAVQQRHVVMHGL